MRNRTLFALLIVILAAASLASCGGSSQPSLVLEPTPAFAGTDDLPALPDAQDFNPSKITAAVSTLRDGNQDFNHSANVTIAGTQAQFGPATGEVAWAVYEFPGSTADIIDSVEYFVSNRSPDGLVWTAISNYAADTWEYFGQRNADHSVFTPTGNTGDYASESGHTYVMILAWDATLFDLDRVTITYGNRYPVTGMVVDMGGAPVPMATVTTSLGGSGVLTDAAGNFTLPAIPDGTWHIMATKPGWIFYNNPEEFTVASGPVAGVEIVGEVNYSHFDPLEDLEPNDSWWEAPNRDPADMIEEYISAHDDPADYYRFVFDTPGQYWFRVGFGPEVYFPHIELQTKEGEYIVESSWVLGGFVYVPIHVATTRVVIAKITCSGGGGMYQLVTGTGELNRLDGYVGRNASDQLEYIRVECTAAGETCYLLSSTSSGTFLNNYMRPVIWTVTPDPLAQTPYSYAPLSYDANLGLGDQTCPDFIGSGAFFNDAFEPNDTKATAYAFPSATVGGEMCNIAGSSAQDWYKVSPAAGKHLIVHADFEYNRDHWGGPGPVYITLENDAGGDMSWGYVTNKGYEVRTMAPCDGTDYFFNVYTSWSNEQIYFYELWVEEVDAYQLQVRALWDSFAIRNAQIHVRSVEYDWLQTFTTPHEGYIECPYFFKDGEELYVDIFRYGTTIDGYTRKIVIDGADASYSFRCDSADCADSYESNDTYGKYVDYPMDFDATMSGYSDPDDKYIFTPNSDDPVRVTITTPDNGFEFGVQLRNRGTDAIIGNQNLVGGGEVIFQTDGQVEHILELNNWGETSADYHLTVDETPGYMLSGTLLDGLSNKVPYSYIYCPALDQQVVIYSWSVDGSYELGPFPPGSYQIYTYAANYESAPSSPYTLNITNADVVQNFVFNINYTDVGEPNDTSGTAMGLANGVPVVANYNGDSDYYDYYSFTVAGPVSVNTYITFEEGFGNPVFSLVDTDGTTQLVGSSIYDAGYQRIDYGLPGAGTYYLRVSGASANDYTIAVNY
ncbi:carboxypeptidase regulatory-like domain-containing protein [bacterium]|nr:carboxypeptidase regulatory-like domain-containing protein [bacterium]